MDIKRLNDQGVHITLSRRNLETLLSKIDRPESARTIGRQTDKGAVWVTSEPDEYHYQGREPGIVHPLDEPVKPKPPAPVEQLVEIELSGPSEIERLLKEVV
jgi:hypothetical protein